MRLVTSLGVVSVLAGGCLSYTAADDLVVLEPAGKPLLYQHLLSEVHRQAAERTKAVEAALASPDAVRARRDALCAELDKLVGPLPPRTPLNARTVGTIECDGYRIEKVIFESQPHHHVTANLYLPADTSKPVPGVLVPCGHSANGKASEFYQAASACLALNGCAALIYDPIGQGERNQLPDTTGHGTNEHTLVGVGALLVGWNTATYRIWDGLRSMDYLAARPEVDPQRLGCTGNSGGGTMTTWLMAVDERIAAAAPSCFITTIERLFNTIGPQDCEQHFPGQGARGIDHTDFITMRAPKPTLILAAEQDYFDFRGTREAYDQAAALYRVLGVPERVGLFSYNDKHGFSPPRREAAVQWMRRWLADDDRPVHEPTLSLQKDADVQVTASGQVMREFDDEVSVVDLANQRARKLAETRKASWQQSSGEERVATIRRVLGLAADSKIEATVERHGTLPRDGYRIEKVVVQRGDGFPLPMLICIPGDVDQAQKRPAVIYADGRGKAAAVEPGGAIDKLVKEGQVVFAVDLRGYGETADDAKGAKYHNAEFRTAMVAMHVGRPLVGQRVEDVLAVLDVARKHPLVDPRASASWAWAAPDPWRCTRPRSSRRLPTSNWQARFILGPPTSSRVPWRTNCSARQFPARYSTTICPIWPPCSAIG